IFTGSIAVWAFPLQIPSPAQEKVATAPGVSGGIAGGIYGGVPSGVQGGVDSGFDSSVVHRVDVKQLKVVHKVVPPYPVEAKKARIQGKVLLDVTLNKVGEVIEVKVISGPPLLVKSAIDAVRQWRYEPSPLLPARTRITITYTLADTPSKVVIHSSSLAAPPASKINGTLALTTKKQGILRAATPGTSAKTHTFQDKNYKYDGEAYNIGSDVKPPELVYSPDPPYAREARNAKLSGDIVLSTVISDDGKVISVKEVSKPLGKDLDESALKTIPTWKFEPAKRSDNPVPVKMLIDVSFCLPK
ncbi:MAG: energy transducer TonB, partial [Terriglobia bacterium]